MKATVTFMKTTFCLLLIFLSQVHNIFADDQSARCYAALDYDIVTCKYFLLATREVQNDLGLTRQQIKSLKLVWLSPITNIPAFVEFRHSHKELLASAHSDEERAKIRKSENEKFELLLKQYEKTTLQNTLSPIQTNRLNELFLQMKGPHAILEDSNLVQKLNLKENQVTELNDRANTYTQFLSLLRQRFLGLQIQTIRKRSLDDVMSEIKALAIEIKEIEKDRDDGLLAVLDQDQSRSWDKLCGAPVSINWKIDYFSDTPFQKK